MTDTAMPRRRFSRVRILVGLAALAGQPIAVVQAQPYGCDVKY